ncbi:uncharacterized protein CIMG_10715 [Coccidioides immitis RS]|uniref:Uncharacterized protein n=1 Tax=Coccidioides immitis (strain RS) TaxID=246410 RepID=A0A0D8JS80_COCIM|nr:uncharacterized protein CIMG_10715 [Coccidioides immitis RS]KJF60190.1 hypothetical protein CIMG_10715 [Coccidioides immitis RS]
MICKARKLLRTRLFVACDGGFINDLHVWTDLLESNNIMRAEVPLLHSGMQEIPDLHRCRRYKT